MIITSMKLMCNEIDIIYFGVKAKISICFILHFKQVAQIPHLYNRNGHMLLRAKTVQFWQIQIFYFLILFL